MAAVNDPIDPSSTETAFSAPWLAGAEFDWVKVISSAPGSNTLTALTGNINAPAQAVLYSPAYPYTFRLIDIVDNFVMTPIITAPLAGAETIQTPTFTWDAVSSAASYDIDYTLVADTLFEHPTSVKSTVNSYTPGNALNAGATYMVRVRVAPGSPLASYWSDAIPFTVTAQSPTSIALVSDHNPSLFGQTVTLNATLSASPQATGVPAGSVVFLDGSTALGTGTIDNWSATYSTPLLSSGNHTIQAIYSGDDRFAISSGSIVQTVNQGNVAIALVSSSNPSISGTTVSFTTTITAQSPASGVPGGSVTFKDGETILVTGNLTSGQAGL